MTDHAIWPLPEKPEPANPVSQSRTEPGLLELMDLAERWGKAYQLDAWPYIMLSIKGGIGVAALAFPDLPVQDRHAQAVNGARAYARLNNARAAVWICETTARAATTESHDLLLYGSDEHGFEQARDFVIEGMYPERRYRQMPQERALGGAQFMGIRPLIYVAVARPAEQSS